MSIWVPNWDHRIRLGCSCWPFVKPNYASWVIEVWNHGIWSNAKFYWNMLSSGKPVWQWKSQCLIANTSSNDSFFPLSWLLFRIVILWHSFLDNSLFKKDPWLIYNISSYFPHLLPTKNKTIQHIFSSFKSFLFPSLGRKSRKVIWPLLRWGFTSSSGLLEGLLVGCQLWNLPPLLGIGKVNFHQK